MTASSVAAASALAAAPPKPVKGGATTGTKKSPRAAASVNVQEGTDENFADQFLNSNKPVLVNFFAFNYCGICRSLAPIVDELAGGLEGRVTVVFVDIERNPGLAEQYRIRTVPTTLIFSGGKVVEKVAGLTSKLNLYTLIQRYL